MILSGDEIKWIFYEIDRLRLSDYTHLNFRINGTFKIGDIITGIGLIGYIYLNQKEYIAHSIGIILPYNPRMNERDK